MILYYCFVNISILLLQVAEWTDETGFQAIAAKYVRLRPHEIEKNKTYIVTTILVSKTDEAC